MGAKVFYGQKGMKSEVYWNWSQKQGRNSNPCCVWWRWNRFDQYRYCKWYWSLTDEVGKQLLKDFVFFNHFSHFQSFSQQDDECYLVVTRSGGSRHFWYWHSDAKQALQGSKMKSSWVKGSNEEKGKRNLTGTLDYWYICKLYLEYILIFLFSQCWN